MPVFNGIEVRRGGGQQVSHGTKRTAEVEHLDRLKRWRSGGEALVAEFEAGLRAPNSFVAETPPHVDVQVSEQPVTQLHEDIATRQLDREVSAREREADCKAGLEAEDLCAARLLALSRANLPACLPWTVLSRPSHASRRRQP